MAFSFRGGVHPRGKKDGTANSAICNPDACAEVWIPVVQHIGAPAVLTVAAGDKVRKGQLIARAESYVSSPVFSSVSGTVKSITKSLTTSGKKVDHVVIENDFAEEEIRLPSLVDPTSQEIRARLREAAGASTLVLIAHRVSTLERADQIIVLREGEIIERGTHEELIALGGVYAKTAAMQSARGEADVNG